MRLIRSAAALLIAGITALPASAQIQIQVEGAGAAGQPRIIINGQEVQGGPIQFQGGPVQLQRPPINNAPQRDEIVKQIEKALKDLEAPAEKIDFAQVRKNLTEATTKLKNLPTGVQVVPPPAIQPIIRNPRLPNPQIPGGGLQPIAPIQVPEK